MSPPSAPNELGRRAVLSATAVGLAGCSAAVPWGSGADDHPDPAVTGWRMAGENAGNTSRLDADAGSEIDDRSWKSPVVSPVASPIVSTPTRAVVSTQSRLLGVDRSDGRVAFAHALPGGMAAAPAVTDDHFLVPRDTFGEGLEATIDLEAPTLYALDRETGQSAWQLGLEGSYLASVAVAEDVYVQSDRETCRLSGEGTTRWRRRFDEPFDWRETLSYLRPVVGPDGVYVGHRGSLVKLDRATGEVRWTRSMGKTVFPPVMATDATVVASTGDATVGVAPADGRVRWRVREPPVWAPAVGERTAVLSTSGELLGIDPATGERRWRVEQPLSTCPPVIAGGTAFTAPGGTTLAAVDAGTGRRIDSRGTDRRVTWVTPDSHGLLTGQSATDGALLERYPLR